MVRAQIRMCPDSPEKPKLCAAQRHRMPTQKAWYFDSVHNVEALGGSCSIHRALGWQDDLAAEVADESRPSVDRLGDVLGDD